MKSLATVNNDELASRANDGSDFPTLEKPAYVFTSVERPCVYEERFAVRLLAETVHQFGGAFVQGREGI